MEFEKIINGIIKYINKEIIPNMNSWQEVLARLALARLTNNSEVIKKSIISNPIIKTFAIVDENEHFDIDGLINDAKTIVREKGVFEIDVPLFGKFKFTENDISLLHSHIRGV